MGNLSLYKSKKYLKRKPRKLTSGCPFKVSKFANRNKDIDTTLSYSDNCENDMSQSTRTHAMNFYCSGDPPCDSLLSAHRNSVNSTSSSANNSTHEISDAGTSSEEGESDYPNNEDNVWNSTYAQNCLAMLKHDSLLKPLIEVLYANSCLKDYMTLVQSLSDGNLSPTNIAFLLCLERAKWQALKTTTQMRFRDFTKKFWLVVYRLLKGKGIRFSLVPKTGDKWSPRKPSWDVMI